MFRRSRSLIASLTTVLLAGSLLVAIAAPARALQAASTSCTTGTETDYEVRPSHGGVFYIDTGITPKLDAAYAGYAVTNKKAGAVSNIWVKVSAFTGGVISLVNPADATQQLSSIDPGDYKTAFFLMKAPAATTTAQTHLVEVYEGRPDLGGTKVYNCTFTFTTVKETIKAAANKVDSALVSSLTPTTATLGGTVVVTVKGQTGVIGSGTSSPDGPIFWATPAALSTWPTRALRLESTQIKFYATSTNRNNDASVLATVTNKLKVYWPDLFGASTSNTYYRANYTFRIIGAGGSAIQPIPINQIASGTQIKHTDTGGITGGTINLSGITSAAIKTEKSAAAITNQTVTVESGVNKAVVTYTITVSTTVNGTAIVDEVVDKPASGTSFVSATFTDVDRTSSTAITPTLSGGELHFTGPFKVSGDGTAAVTSAVFTYTMKVPCDGTAYSNSAYSVAGDIKSGLTASTFRTVNFTGTYTAGTPNVCNATPAQNTLAKSPTVSTTPATSITGTTATLNGFANAEGNSGVTVTFQYGTASDLTGATAAVPASNTLTNASTSNESFSKAITGLSPDTTYYFRLEILVGGTAQGAILSFTTPSTAVYARTSAATSVANTSATLNGSYNTQTRSGTLSFRLSTSSAVNATGLLSSSPTTVAAGAVSSGDQTTTGSATGLTAGTRYFFQILFQCTTASECPTSGYAVGEVLNFITTGAQAVTTDDAINVADTTADVYGSWYPGGTDFTRVYMRVTTNSDGTGGDLYVLETSPTAGQNGSGSISLTGLTPGTRYYYRTIGCTTATTTCPTSGTPTGTLVLGSIEEFVTLKITKLSFPDGYVGESYSQTLTGIGGCEPYTWKIVSGSLPAGLSLNATTGVISGSPTTSGTYNFRVSMTDDCSMTRERDYTIGVSVPFYGPYPQTITFPQVTDRYLNEANPTSDPTASSGLPVTVTNNTPTICTYTAPGRITMLAVGSCSLTATQGGNGYWLPATPVTMTFRILGPAPQRITFPPVPNMNYGGPNPSSNPTASSGLPVTVTNNTPTICTWAAPGVITILAAGTCSLTANQPGNSNWLPAAPVTITFVISPLQATVTVNPATKEQGTADPACTYVIAGASGITGITCSRNPGELPGTYPVTPAGGNFGGGYSVTYIPGNLTITPARNVAPSPGGSYTPVTMNLTTIQWQPSPTLGASYQINLNGRTVCTTSDTSCSVKAIVGPKSKVEVAALIANLKSPLVKLTYLFDKPIVAVTVYFDVDKSVIKSADAKEVNRVTTILKREGFNEFSVEGHTDSDASAAYNLALSARRNVALKAESSKLLPRADYNLTPKGLTDPAADNNTKLGKAKNRRATLFITG